MVEDDGGLWLGGLGRRRLIRSDPGGRKSPGVGGEPPAFSGEATYPLG